MQSNLASRRVERKKKLRSKEWLLKRKKDLESKDAKIKSEAEMSDVLPALCNSF